MRFWVGVTDYDWFTLHASKGHVDEVNFWKPSEKGSFKALPVGGLFLFKLHSPRNYIAGGGFFAKFLQIPLSLAWDAFAEANGAGTLLEMRRRISKYRHQAISAVDDPTIGCILLAEPFFFPESEWIPMPDNFKLNTVVGKTYESEDNGPGHRLWHQVNERLTFVRESLRDPGPALVAAADARFGNARLVMPRLGQGGLAVTGGLNLGGSIETIFNPISVVELAIEKGADSILMPVSSRRQLNDLPDHLAAKITIHYYLDARDALLKALAV